MSNNTFESDDRRAELSAKLRDVQAADWSEGPETIPLAAALAPYISDDDVLRIDDLPDDAVEELIGLCDSLAEARGYAWV